MKRIVTLHAALIIVVCLALVGCGTPPTSTPIPLSEFFKEQINRFLSEGAKLNAMTEQGVNYANFGEQVANAKGPYDLASTRWPPDFAPGAQAAIDHAFEGWNLALDLWAMKVEGGATPKAPGTDYDRFVSYEKDLAVTGNMFGGDCVQGATEVERKCLPFDENISVLLTIAGASFDEGQTLILSALP